MSPVAFRVALLGLMICDVLSWQLDAYAADVAAAKPQSLRKQVEELLALGEKNTPQAVEAADACYESLRQQTHGDVRIDYAYAVVLVEQHRYPDANRQLAALVKAHADDLHAWRLKIWAQMLDKSYDGALADMQRLAKRYPQEKAAVAEQDNEFFQDSAFLCGQFCGFLAGPRASIVKKLELDRAITRLQEAVGPEYWGSFEEGRLDVQQRFEQAQRELALLIQADQRAAEKKRQSQVKRVELEKANLEERRQAIQSKSESHTQSAKDLAQIDAQLRSLLETRHTVDDRVLILDAQLAADNVIKTQQVPATAPLAARRANWTAINNQVQKNNARTADRNRIVQSLNRQLTGLNSQILVLQARRAALAMQLDVEGNTLENSTERLAKEEKLVKQVERKQKHSTTPAASMEARELTVRIRSLRGYQEFPGDEESQRVKHWYD